MAQLGVRTIDELVGRVDLLKQRDLSSHWKACTLDLKALLHRPKVAPTVAELATKIEQALTRQLNAMTEAEVDAALATLNGAMAKGTDSQ